MDEPNHSYWSSHRLFKTFSADIRAAGVEFVGSALFILLGLGGIQAASSEVQQSGSTIEHMLYNATSMGLSLLVTAWLFYRVTGGLFNPDITLALFLVGVVGPVRFVLYSIAQLVGAIAGSAILYGLTPGPLDVNTSLREGINPAQGVFMEMFITATLVIAVLMLAAEKHIATPFAPVGIGLTLFVGHLFAVFYTGASMNTARSFGPAVVTGFDYLGHSNHWVYWVGPFLGSLLGTAVYTMLKAINYLELNPTQASTRTEDSPQKRAIFATGPAEEPDEAKNGSEGSSESPNEERRHEAQDMGVV